jgi:hypothetical protein
VPELQRMLAVPPYTLGRLHADTGAVGAWVGTRDTTTAGAYTRPLLSST